MADLIIPDVSKYQGTIDWKKLVSGGYKAAIIRAHNGYSQDATFDSNRANAHAAGIRALGIYQYVVSGRDAAAQATDLAATVGSLKAGEWVICDLESGSGDQSARAKTWHSTVMSKLHATEHQTELYSGLSFFQTHGLAKAGFSRLWIAAYRSTEPSSPSHELWQFTDAHAFPGIASKCDASKFHGSVDQLLAHIAPVAAKPPAPAPKPTAKPTVDLSKLIAAAKTDPKAKQGHVTYSGTKTVENALVAEGLLAKSLADGSYGTATITAYAKWQRRCGYTSPAAADGIPGKTSLTKLGAKHGFSVVA